MPKKVQKIVVNVGNSRTKWAIFQGADLVKTWSNPTTQSRSEAPDLAFDLEEGMNGSASENQIVYICSVVPSASLALIEALHEHGFEPREIRLDTQKTIRGLYPTFGTDRLANCIAAHRLYGQKSDNQLVLDFGTATTISAINKSGEFLGGMITLGFQDTLTAIGNRLEQLPIIDSEASAENLLNVNPLSHSTRESIFAGTFLGQLGAVEKWVNQCKKALEGSSLVVATGGLSTYIGQHLQTDTIDSFDKELTLKGINFIAEEIEGEGVLADPN